MRYRAATIGGIALAIGLAVPASAQTHERFTIDDEFEKSYSCGVVETTQVHGDATAYFAADGSWRSTTIHFQYEGRFVDPATGDVIEQRARQNLTERAGEVSTRGQGIFLRLHGEGVVLHDVGRLVFDPTDGSTSFASAKVLAFDDPEAEARIDAAVCSLFD